MNTLVNPNPGSARMAFQWKYFKEYYDAHELPDGKPPMVLNVGCSDDPLSFGLRAYHYDFDDWTSLHKWFKQGDAHALPFPDRSFDLVIMGDIHEHLTDPLKATLEACRVLAPDGTLVITIFEEWRLPGHGQWVEASLKQAEAEIIKVFGEDHNDREIHEQTIDPRRVYVSDSVEPHMYHINQFDDDDIRNLVRWISDAGFEVIEFLKAYEATHEGHDWYNWLIAARRTS